MGFFGLGKKKKDVIDLTERYKRQQAKMNDMKSSLSDSSTGLDSSSETLSSDSSESNSGIGIFGAMANANSGSSSSNSSGSDYLDVSAGADSGIDLSQKRKRFAKRIMDMTEKLEDLSNQIYHLQQRIEVLEKKSGSRY